MSVPSWHNSTLSQAFIGSLAFYCAVLLLVTTGLIWRGLDVETAKLVIGWASALEMSVMSAYLTARKPNGNPPGGANAQPDH